MNRSRAAFKFLCFVLLFLFSLTSFNALNEIASFAQGQPTYHKIDNADGSENGSLRQAIKAAEGTPGVDTIDLTGIKYIALDRPLIINKGNNINFVSDGNTTINGTYTYQNQTYKNQIMNVQEANITISRLIFADGYAKGGDGVKGGGGGWGAGGALFMDKGSNVILNNVAFLNNKAIGGNGAAGAKGGNSSTDGNSSTAKNSGKDGEDGGNGGGLNSSMLGGNGGSRGISQNDQNGRGLTPGHGSPGSNGTDLGKGGGGGGGGAGLAPAVLVVDSGRGGNGGNGGNGGYGAGGGGGGGSGANDSTSEGIFGYQVLPGDVGTAGKGGEFGGNGYDGKSGVAVSTRSTTRSGRVVTSRYPNGGDGGTGGGGAGLGGAIFVNQNAILTLINCVFSNNSVAGGTGGNNGQGIAENIFNYGGTVKSNTNIDSTHGDISILPPLTQFYEYNGFTYSLSSPGTWHQAQAQAQGFGGNLVTIRDAAENSWLVKTFGVERHWIGYTNEDADGTSGYKWASGEASNFTKWHPGEPNNSNGNQHYAYINFVPSDWDDVSGDQFYSGIIENKFYEFKGSKYLLSGSATWEQAKAQAESLSGHLVTIDSPAEKEWLVKQFGNRGNLWIGLKKDEQGQFKGNDTSGNISYPGIIEIDLYNSLGKDDNDAPHYFNLAKPEKFNVSAIGGAGNDIFQLQSYKDLTTAQTVYGGKGSDIFNVLVESTAGIIGLDFNAGKLRDLAMSLLGSNTAAQNRAVDITTASINSGIDAAAIAAKYISGEKILTLGIGDGLVDAIATAAHYAYEMISIQGKYNSEMREYQDKIEGIGKIFEGQESNNWGNVDTTLRRSIVRIMDFEPGIDIINLPIPSIADNGSYSATTVNFSIGGKDYKGVEVKYNDQTNHPSTILQIHLMEGEKNQDTVNGQSNADEANFISSLTTYNINNAVIGKTLNRDSKVAVSGSNYTGTIAGDYIYIPDSNDRKESVSINGNAGNDLLVGRKTGKSIIDSGDGDDLIFPGSIDDYIDGKSGYDQVDFSQSSKAISLALPSDNIMNIESVIGTKYRDVINFINLKVFPDNSNAFYIEGRDGDDDLAGSNDAPNVIYGGRGNDSLLGGDNYDFLLVVDNYNNVLDGALESVNISFPNPGLGEKDILRGGKGKDRFILGNATTAYYDDSNAQVTLEDGYADIQGFEANSGDVIQLHGEMSDYRLDVNGADTNISLLKPNNKLERISIVRNQTKLGTSDLVFTPSGS